MANDGDFLDRKHTQTSMMEDPDKEGKKKRGEEDKKKKKKKDEKEEPKPKKKRRNYSNREKSEWLSCSRARSWA